MRLVATAPLQKKIAKTLPKTVLGLFPVPRFLCMPAVGIDISDESIKYTAFKRKANGAELSSWGKVSLPAGYVENGVIQNPHDLAQALKKIQRDNRFEFAHVSLPEEHAYLFELSLPKEGELALDQAIEFHLKEHVPLSPDEAVIDYLVLNKPTSPTYELSVSVYPTKLVAEYLDVFLEVGLRPLSFEIEGQATARALVSSDTDETVMIVDLGTKGAGVSIVSAGNLEFTATLETAGNELTRTIAKELGTSFSDAEELKKKAGFIKTPENEKVFSALFDAVIALKEEINKHYLFWQMHRKQERADAKPIERIILCGGNAAMKGLPEYLSAMLDVPVEVGNVWTNVLSFESGVPPLPLAESLQYATTIGLALRSLKREGI